MINNPLLSNFETPFHSAPFDLIKNEHYLPAFKEAILSAKKEIDAIINNKEQPTFKNTIEALEQSGKKLSTISAIFFNLHSAETNDELENIAEEVSPLLSEHSNDVILNEELFKRVKAVYELKEIISSEQLQLLDKTFKSFARNGALLNETDKNTLREIDIELSGLTLNFSKNVLQETNAFLLHIEQEEDLKGIPDSIRQMAFEEAQNRGLAGWVFTLQYPSFVPFMKYAQNRELRATMYLASGKKAYQNNEFNNAQNIHKIVALRGQRAKLLGYNTFADFVLEERMAKSANTVLEFEQDLLHKAKPFAEKEIEELKNLAHNDGVQEMMPYDHAYYAEQLREAKYELNDELLKPYFPLAQVLNAAFTAAEKLYGFTFQKRTDIPVYHQDVEVYEVKDNGLYKGLFYTDFFPREGKRPGAWETSFKEQYKLESLNERPHISIVCNFSKPTSDKPSLLTFGEVTTLFHEFGHSLHGLNADTQYESLSGTNVFWDFVELPSQFMENYCYDKSFLKTFAKHYQTGADLPENLIDKIIASANFMEGYQTLRQLGFGILDMAYHTGELGDNESIESFELRKVANTQLYPHIEGTAMSPSFSHIFAGGYAAGYYSYKWSEVLDADAFAYFKETGIFNPETAIKFKTLLSKGGTVDPMELYVNFRGRKPTVDALVERAGLTASIN